MRQFIPYAIITIAAIAGVVFFVNYTGGIDPSPRVLLAQVPVSDESFARKYKSVKYEMRQTADSVKEKQTECTLTVHPIETKDGDLAVLRFSTLAIDRAPQMPEISAAILAHAYEGSKYDNDAARLVKRAVLTLTENGRGKRLYWRSDEESAVPIEKTKGILIPVAVRDMQYLMTLIAENGAALDLTFAPKDEGGEEKTYTVSAPPPPEKALDDLYKCFIRFDNTVAVWIRYADGSGRRGKAATGIRYIKRMLNLVPDKPDDLVLVAE